MLNGQIPSAYPRMPVIEFSPLQIEYQRNCFEDPYQDHRWNGKIGATRSGKTTLDVRWTITFRIVARKGLQGLNVMSGVSLGSIGRNVLEPMRSYWEGWGLDKVISETRVDREGNTYVMIFGEKVYLIGMGDKKATKRIRGMEWKYWYADELAECAKEVFILAKSRMSLPYSCCDFTCNPESDTHWLYAFINEKDLDLFVQNYTIFDNPFLDPEVVRNLCNEYKAQEAYYRRYILGQWVRAEGSIYKLLADASECFILKENEIPRLMYINIGVDFGGNLSKHSFTATGFSSGFKHVVILESERPDTNLTPNELEDRFIAFVNRIRHKYQVPIKQARLDSAEQVLIRGIKYACQRKAVPVPIMNAIKGPIRGRIDLVLRLLGTGRIWWTDNSRSSLNAFKTAVWSDKKDSEGKDIRLDDGSTDIDSIDSTEYSIEPELNNLLKTLGGK